MIDDIEIQIIKDPQTPRGWFRQSYYSVSDQIPEKNIKVYEGDELGILEKRLHFIQNCKTPFLGWVEDRDLIIPNTLTKCRSLLIKSKDRTFCGVFTAYGILNENKNFTSIQNLEQVCLGGNYTQGQHLAGVQVPTPFMLFRLDSAKKALTIPSQFFGARAYSNDLISGYALLYGPWKKVFDPLYIKRMTISQQDFEESTTIRDIVYKQLNSIVPPISTVFSPIKT